MQGVVECMFVVDCMFVVGGMVVAAWLSLLVWLSLATMLSLAAYLSLLARLSLAAWLDRWWTGSVDGCNACRRYDYRSCKTKSLVEWLIAKWLRGLLVV